MSEEKEKVCPECGRGQGWHDVWCGVLRRVPLGLGKVVLELESSAVTVVEKLPEVE